jgi:putative redox protein
MPSETFGFPGHAGHVLAGRLERPAGQPRAAALFAHCFTCGKDLAAARRISRRLVADGYAVLGFDFTGLGDSEGDFAATGFASNVADLVAAARAMEGRPRSGPPPTFPPSRPWP